MDVLIVDDEELARDRLSLLLQAFEGIRIVGEAEDGEHAMERIIELPTWSYLIFRWPVVAVLRWRAPFHRQVPKLFSAPPLTNMPSMHSSYPPSTTS